MVVTGYPRSVRSGIFLAAGICFVALCLAPTPSAATRPVKATFVGDSVAASLGYVTSARAELRRGVDVHFDLAVCRRLVQPSCAHQGATATTALEAVQGYGRALGEVLIVKVGYNESAYGYREGIDRVMRAALRQGASAVVWVTLRETSSIYHGTNVAIRRAAKRWRQLTVADWNAYSGGKSWFRGDGLHLTVTGANELAAFVRQHVLKAAKTTSRKS